MSRLLAEQRYTKTKSRRRLSLERLETRQLLSVTPGNLGGSLGSGGPQPASEVALAGPLPSTAPPDAAQSFITTTTPANGDQLAQSPSSLVVTFNQEVDIFWADGSVLLDRVGADGTLTPVFDLNNLPVATFDPTGFQATIPLDQPLTPGRYRIVLAGGSGVSQTLDDGSWDSTIDQPLADFTVVQPGVTLNDATNLGTLGSQVQTVSSSLDLSTGQNSVALYQVTLGPDHFWQLGVELDAQRIGSDLLGALTLFDSSGNVLATRNSGTGVSSAANDPYLFAGLKPGVYYIGVSGAGNLAGQPGGYNPVDGTVGSAGQAQAGGDFNLKLVADTADVPTWETGFTLNWQDPLSAVPTGFSLAFSGPIDPSSVVVPGGRPTGIQVVDATGKSWPVYSVVGQSNQQMSFVFGQQLPPGRYTLEVPTTRGIKDLVGRSPVGSGLGGNILGTWRVLPSKSPAQPNDQGVAWPGVAGGFSGTATILPGQTVVYRTVIPEAGLYSLQTKVQGGALQVQRLGSDGLVVLDRNTNALLTNYDMNLTNGVYLISMTAVGTQPATVEWVLKPKAVKTDALLDNGVGQSAALNLRLFNASSSYLATNAPPDLSTVTSENVAPVSSSPVTPSSQSGVQLAIAAVSGPAVSYGGLAPIPASLLVTVNSGLLGGASTQSEQIAVVGPAVPGGTVALTDSSSGLLPGIIYRSQGTAPEQTPDRPDDAVGQAGPVVADRGSAGSPSASAATSLEEAQRSSQADSKALVQADRLAGIAAMIGRLFSLGAGADEAPPLQNGQTTPHELLADATAEQPGELGGVPRDNRADRIEQAEIGVPTTLVLASAAAYRLRQLTKHWWRRSFDKKDPYKRPRSSGLGPGPRSFRKKTGVTRGLAPSQRH
jgi:methionine-rich copper-binding protein CopC